MNIVLIPALLLLVGFSLYKKVLEPRRAGGGERPAKPEKERGKPAKSRAKEPRAKEGRFKMGRAKKVRAKETPEPAAAVGSSGWAGDSGSGSGSAARSTARSAARPGSGRMGSVL